MTRRQIKLPEIQWTLLCRLSDGEWMDNSKAGWHRSTVYGLVHKKLAETDGQPCCRVIRITDAGRAMLEKRR